MPAALLLLTAASVSIAVSQNHVSTIEFVDVHGNRRLSDEQVLKFISTRAGEKLNEQKLQADLRSLLETGEFVPADTRVTTTVGRNGGTIVIFEVREHQIITQVTFDGLKYLEREEIIQRLKADGVEIRPETPYDPTRVRKAREAIWTYLVERGFSEAKVVCLEEEVSATALKVEFRIDEMPDDGDNQL